MGKHISDERAKTLLEKWGKVLDVSSEHVKPIEDSKLNLNTAILLPSQERWLTKEEMAELNKDN